MRRGTDPDLVEDVPDRQHVAGEAHGQEGRDVIADSRSRRSRRRDSRSRGHPRVTVGLREPYRGDRARTPPRREHTPPRRDHAPPGDYAPPEPEGPPPSSGGRFFGDKPLSSLSHRWGVYHQLHDWRIDAVFGQRFQPTELTDDDLDRLVEGLQRDKIMWIGPGNQRNNQENVRVNVRFRGNFTNTYVKMPHWMWDWKKTSFIFDHNRWSLLEREAATATSCDVPAGCQLVVILQPPMPEQYRVHMCGTSPKKTPPKPPRPSRDLKKLKCGSKTPEPVAKKEDDYEYTYEYESYSETSSTDTLKRSWCSGLKKPVMSAESTMKPKVETAETPKIDEN